MTINTSLLGAPGPSTVRTSDLSKGAAIMLISAILYACGLTIQRAAMTTNVKPVWGCRNEFARKHAIWLWAVGLVVYGIGGMGLGTLALTYIPLALCSTLFSLTLFFNAMLSKMWLGEAVGTFDLVCYLAIVTGVVLSSVFLPKETTVLRIDESAELFTDQSAIFYLLVWGLPLIALQVMIVCVFERKYDDPVYHYSRRSRRIYRIAMLSYPTILGVLEGIGYTGLKVVNNWYAFWSAGDDKQIQHWFFWVSLAVAPVLAATTLVWLKKCYLRFPVTESFPIELAALTLTSVTGGLFVHDERFLLSRSDGVFVAIGLLLLLGAMCTLALVKSVHGEVATVAPLKLSAACEDVPNPNDVLKLPRSPLGRQRSRRTPADEAPQDDSVGCAPECPLPCCSDVEAHAMVREQQMFAAPATKELLTFGSKAAP